MGWFSKVRSFFRQVVRVVIEAIHRLNPVTFWPNLVMGISGWPTQKLRLHVVVLADANGPVISAANWQDLVDSIGYATTTFKRQLNVEVVPYSGSFIDVMKKPAPGYALDVTCDAAGYGAEWGDKGDFFADNLAGWNAIPISRTYPITVFVVKNSQPTHGCSFGPLTDYIVVDPIAISHISTMAHEIGHACGLPHWFATQKNLMFADHVRGDHLTWFQRTIFNASRHVRLF